MHTLKKQLEQLELEQSPNTLFSQKAYYQQIIPFLYFTFTSLFDNTVDMIADKSRRKWGKIVLARLTFRSLARRINYESATSKSRFHHDLRVSFSEKFCQNLQNSLK